MCGYALAQPPRLTYAKGSWSIMEFWKAMMRDAFCSWGRSSIFQDKPGTSRISQHTSRSFHAKPKPNQTGLHGGRFGFCDRQSEGPWMSLVRSSNNPQWSSLGFPQPGLVAT